MNQKTHTIANFKKRWQLFIVLEVLLYALGPAFLVYLLNFNFLWVFGTFFLVFFTFIFVKKPWKLSLDQVSSYIDNQLEEVQYSSRLTLIPAENLPALAQLQQRKIQVLLTEKISTIRPKTGIFKAILSVLGCILIGFVVAYFDFGSIKKNSLPGEQVAPISFQSVDSIEAEMLPPKITDQYIDISYPAYTGISSRRTKEMNLEISEGSQLRWVLRFDKKVDTVFLEWGDRLLQMHPLQLSYGLKLRLDASGFYNFRFSDSLDNVYLSDIYSIKFIADQAPVLEVSGVEPYINFNYDEEKSLHVQTSITDDYGIADAFITATVTRGSGESVKFREQQLAFEGIKPGKKHLKLSKTINLDSLDMQPGDELYFHIETRDLKEPQANISRSETYFAKIKDTITYSYAAEGTLGVDQMPAYFRSQRQLIIDTEKLIAEQPKLSKQEFNSRSNALGAEQNALRMKYGKFMGDEQAGGEAHEHEGHDHEAKNPIAGYMHNHDGSNEHNLVQEDAEQAQKDTTSTGNGSQFERSLHGKMRIALGEMWDSELQLRINEPEKSLPYQHRALELLQDIKNAARIYVHRIGFDPPPIKEDTRLSGSIDDVRNYQKKEQRTVEPEEEAMRESTAIIEELLTLNLAASPENRMIFRKAGEELAAKALEQPASYLKLLQNLKWLSETKEIPSRTRLLATQNGLFSALDIPESSPGKAAQTNTGLDRLMLEALEQQDE